MSKNNDNFGCLALLAIFLFPFAVLRELLKISK